MKFTKTYIEDLIILEPQIFGDQRGYFIESYNEKVFFDNVTKTNFVQDNESKSSRGVLRGLHFQNPPFEQAKLVRVIDGEVLDVAVDLRKKSQTYGKYFSIVLSGENKKQLFVPRGFAHGFVVLSETAIFSYKVDNYYSPQNDSGIIWNDSDLKINWQIDEKEVLLSDKDSKLINFKSLISPF